MAKDAVTDWSTTAASNTDVGGISLAENVMRPPAVNDAFREVMEQIATWITNPKPAASDGGALGTSALMWSDLFLALGAVINFNNGDVTVTHSANDINVAGGTLSIEAVPVSTNIPQNSQSAAYTLVLGDAQKHILHPTADNNARTFTIPANASVAYPVGTAITFVNQINTVTIAITTDTLVLAGAGTTGSRTLAANGVATALKIASTTWVISGTGLT